ncbi:MAG: cytidine deaminase [Chloroflexi bacterium]|nr:cytidine deaminase [Chloroflexota bacterium]
MAADQGTRDTHLIELARSVATGGDCTFLKVGAVLVRDDAVLSVGHLGTPHGVAPCAEGGCPACAAGQALSQLCTCVHAETAAVLAAARNGISVAGATCYGTHKPCMECLKQLMHAGIVRAVYGTARPRDADYLRAYDALVRARGIVVEALAAGT